MDEIRLEDSGDGTMKAVPGVEKVEGAQEIKAALKKVFKPNPQNPATFTVRLDLDGVIVAADDFTPSTHAQYKAAMQPILDELRRTQDAMLRIAQQTVQGKTPEERQQSTEQLRAVYEKEETAYDAAQEQKRLLWEETARRQFKGIWDEEAEKFYAADFDEELPIPPAHAALIGALIARVSNGGSGADFLPPR